MDLKPLQFHVEQSGESIRGLHRSYIIARIDCRPSDWTRHDCLSKEQTFVKQAAINTAPIPTKLLAGRGVEPLVMVESDLVMGIQLMGV